MKIASDLTLTLVVLRYLVLGRILTFVSTRTYSFPQIPEASWGSCWKSDVNQYGWTIKNISNTFQLPISRPKSYYEEMYSPNTLPGLTTVLISPPTAQYYTALALFLQSASLQLRLHCGKFPVHAPTDLSMGLFLAHLATCFHHNCYLGHKYVCHVMDVHCNSRFDRAGELGTLGTF